MPTMINRPEMGDPNRVAEINRSTRRVETEFASVLQSVSQKSAPSREERIRQAVSNASQKYNLSPALILAVIKQESNFNPVAESPCGAQGCMQLMPETARQMGVTDSFNIEQNIDGGSRYLREMVDRFDGDLKLALAAYNAGPGRVEQYNGIPPIAETMNYVPSVLGHFESFGGSAAVSGGISRLDLQTAVAALTAERISSTPVIPFPEVKRRNESDEPPPPPPHGAIRA